MLRVLMVEDNEAQAVHMRELLARYGAEQDLAVDVTVLSSALPLADLRQRFDLVLMDIELPGMDGLEAARELRGRDQDVPLIFVTNLAQMAVQGYEVDALDFLVKPVSYGALALRLDKVRRVLARQGGSSVTLTTRDGLRVVPLDQLVSVEVRQHNLFYQLQGEPEPIRIRGVLAVAEEQLASAPFVRISKSCLANMALIRRVDGDRLLMEGGTELWFSRARKKPAMEELTRYLAGRA